MVMLQGFVMFSHNPSVLTNYVLLCHLYNAIACDKVFIEPRFVKSIASYTVK